MIYASEYGGGHDTQSVPIQSTTFGVSISVSYWVLDDQGRLADSEAVEALPGAEMTDSPYSIGLETPVCGSCSELQAVLLEQLRTAHMVAADHGCRLLAVGVRPDQLAEATDEHPAETAGVAVRFETPPQHLNTVYNVLLALDPAFVLLSECGDDAPGDQRQTTLSADTRVVEPYRFDGLPAEDGRSILSAEHTDVERRRRPVRLVDETTVEWRSLDSSTPTLLVDLIADVTAILQEATQCQIEIGTFGNGFEVGCLRLPTAAWRQRYTEDAITNGTESLRLRAYLERLGFETDWYRLARPPAIGSESTPRLSTSCQQRAELLAADVGCSPSPGSN